MKQMLRLTLVFLLALCGSAELQAQTINVPSAAAPTIQAGIDAAPPGATVVVAAGTYHENIDFKGKAITVTSVGTGVPILYANATTIIDGGLGNTAAVSFVNGETRASILNGFTVQNGGFETAGPNAPDNTLGGIYVFKSQPTIKNNFITNNHCHGIFSNGGSPLITNNNINNTLDVLGNCSDAGGAAIWLFHSLGNANNGTPITGEPATVLGNIIENNVSSGKEPAPAINGGVGVNVSFAYALIVNNIIRNNTTLAEGAIFTDNTNDVLILSNLIYGNSAAATTAGLDLNPPGLGVGPFQGIVASNTIYNNILTSTRSNLGTPGSQMRLSGNLSQFLVVNNVIVGTTPGVAAVACGESFAPLSITPLVYDHNDIFNGGAAAYGGACPDPTNTYGNISADPRFKNQAAVPPDLHLLPGSPAIDAGNNSSPLILPVDIDIQPRIQDATGRGFPVIDMGAYELAGVTTETTTRLELTPSTYTPYQVRPDGTTAPFTLAAKLTSTAGTPTGSITFFEDGIAIGNAPVDGTGNATFEVIGATQGIHAFTASYPAQAPVPLAVSVKFYVKFPKATPTISINGSPNPAAFGTSVTFTVVVSSPDGTVPSPITVTDTTTNTVLATLTPDASGTASFPIDTLAVGSHVITASFAGSASSSAQTSLPFTEVITAGAGTTTTTSITSSVNPSNVLQPVTFTAHVTGSGTTGTPTGTVTFSDGATAFATVPVDATGTAISPPISTLTASPPAHIITATFNPTGTFTASSASLSQVVNAALVGTKTTVNVSPNPSVYGQPILFSAHVAPASGTTSPTGSVVFTFCRGATVKVPLDANGNASFVDPVPGAITEPAGPCTVVASYSGDAGNQPSTSAPLAYLVTPGPSNTKLTAQPNPANQGQNVNLTAAVSGVPATTINPVTGQPLPPGLVAATGTVQFYDGSVLLGSAVLVNGQAVLTINTLTPGTHTLTAVYPGDANLGASSSTLVTETILPSTFTITLTPATLSVVSRQRTKTTVTLASLGGFTGTLTLSTGTLPKYALASFNPGVLSLTPGSTATSTLSIDTVDLPPGIAQTRPGPLSRTRLPYALAGLLALPLLLLRRRRLPALLAVFAAAALMLSSAGCTNIAFALNTVAPGTYIIPVTATDSTTHNTQTANLTLTVTP